MTLKGGTGGACAACKFQRKRCAADCQLAPYFPAEQPKLFQNVHKLFGVKSIIKTLKNLDEYQKPEAIKSIIFQSYVRDRSPVHGCLGVTQQLQYMMWLAEEELRVVNAQLQLCRQQNNNNNNNNSHPMIQVQEISDTNDVTSQLDLGMGPPVKGNNYSNPVPFFGSFHVSQPQQRQWQPQQQVSYSYSCSDVKGYSSANYTDSRENLVSNNSIIWGQQYPYGDFNHNDNNNDNKNHASNGVMAIQSQLLNPQLVAIQQDSAQDYDEIHPFLDIIDDRQSFVDTKEAYESSSEESLKDTTQLIEHVGENELKSAATCFSLTSVN